jgi:hypothetical protein
VLKQFFIHFVEFFSFFWDFISVDSWLQMTIQLKLSRMIELKISVNNQEHG